MLTAQRTSHAVASCGVEPDWELVRAVIDIEAGYRLLTQAELCEEAGIERTVLHNLGKGRPVSDASLRRIESVLGMPRMFLLLIARHDEQAIEETDANRDLVRLVRQMINEAEDDTPGNTNRVTNTGL